MVGDKSWPRARLGEFANVQGGFAYPSKEFCDDGVPVLKIKNVRFRDVDTTEVACVSQSLADETTRYYVQHGDILISLTGSGPNQPNSMVGRVARFNGASERFLLNQRIGRFVITKPMELESQYLYYVLTDQAYQIELVHSATGSANQANISSSQIGRLEIPLPPLPEQKAIAHILGTLDDKIELNRRMNATLEGLARALFKSWFVDFDPVRAKMDGRPSEGMDAETAALFPDGFEDSELGPVPRGWRVCKISEIGRVVCGKTPSTKVSEYFGNDVPFITIPDMHGNVFVTRPKKLLSQHGAASQNKKTLPAGSICVSCIATPGLVVITTEESQTNQQINSIVPQKAGETYFWYWTLSGMRDEIRAGGSGGSVLTNLSTGRFSAMQVLSPSTRIRRRYHESVSPVFSRYLHNQRQTELLSTIRDTLLPKLLSGEISVAGAAKEVEGVV
ncbi:restriction endonuclease subunit S [Symmachiella dynata]|uniref:restriction endonuclease subunit S n=1 Tax=Symmachiella dynata TaxID=2527995 RepID=UPI0030ECB798